MLYDCCNYYLPDSYLHLLLLILVFLVLLYSLVVIWIYDLLLFSSAGLLPLCIENALVLAFIIFIATEVILFLSLFIYHFNARFYYVHYLFSSFPTFLLSSIYCFGLAFTNLLLLLYSSFSIQSSIIFIKSGMRYLIIDSLGHSIQSSTLFLLLQLIEFIYSLSNLFDSSIYSIFSRQLN